MTGYRLLGLVGPFAVALGLLAALEGALRLAGFEEKIGSGGDPKANLLPLFRPATAPDGTPVLRRSDAAIEFRLDKPANGLRVFVLGESSVFGFPLGPDLAFSRFLGDRLAAAFPDHAVEVVNAGVPAIGSWHVRRIVEEEVVRYRPDVVVIYTGHNDWILPPPAAISPLRRALLGVRTYQLAVVAGARWRRWRNGPLAASQLHDPNDAWGEARGRARGVASLTRRREAELIDRFADNLRAIVRAGEGAGARVVLATLAQNLRNFAPGASRHRRGLSAVARARWRALAEDADRRRRAGDCVGALRALGAARRLDSRPAIGEYLRAECLDQLGQLGRARAAYWRASDLDEVPLGARSSSNALIRRVSAETGAGLVDVAAALARASPHGLVGSELFVDHLHPSVAGHVAIARALARALGAPATGYTWPDPEALLAGNPDARKHTVISNVVLDMVLGWYDAALAEIDAGKAWYPGLAGARAGIERASRDDAVPAWSDLPDAAD